MFIIRNTLIIVFLLQLGCTSYKELRPEPEITSIERGYIELKKDRYKEKNKDKDFTLKKGKKYFVLFPQPESNNYLLILNSKNKLAVNSFLTRSFNKGKGEIKKIPDITESSDSLNVYALDQKTLTFYWMIDTVKQDHVLELKYRYTPAWRYKFENKYTEFLDILDHNRIDREKYISIGINFSPDDFEYDSEIEKIGMNTPNVKSILDELLNIESIFPPNILDTSDEAYQNYTDLKNQVKNELKFQEDYRTVLRIFSQEYNSRYNIELFLQTIPDFLEFLSDGNKYQENINDEVKIVLSERLDELFPYYDDQVKLKKRY